MPALMWYWYYRLFTAPVVAIDHVVSISLPPTYWTLASSGSRIITWLIGQRHAVIVTGCHIIADTLACHWLLPVAATTAMPTQKAMVG